MTYRVYGTGGKPMVAFPCSQAHENLWEDFGMVDALAEYIERGEIQLFAMDSIDDDTFFRSDLNRNKAIRCYERYLNYIADEFLPNLVKESGQKVLLTGCSMGAYHAANIYFRWPQLADSVIALSGVYSPQWFLDLDEHMTAAALENSPIDYLSLPLEAARRDQYAAAKLIFCTGQGDGEEQMLNDTQALAKVLADQGIEAWIDVWGQDATHDWPWWQQQMNKFLPTVLAA